MSKSLLHDWESSIELNKGNTEELLKIAEDVYNTAYARGKASEEKPQGEWIEGTQGYYCSICEEIDYSYYEHNYCPYCGAKMVKQD